MPAIQVRLVADEPEAFRIADILEARLEFGEAIVTREETPAYSLIWTIDTLFPDSDAESAVARVKDLVGSDAFACPLEVIEIDESANWVAMSLETLQPVRAGRFLVHGSHDRGLAKGAEVALEIDAQMAFGTGHHATTRGCLLALDRLLSRRRYRRVLDLGTGTGVLAFAIARVQRSAVLATDIDPVSVTITAENARINRVAPWIEAVTAPGLVHPRVRARAPFDLVVANILARPLMSLAPAIRASLAPGAHVVLSGLRVEDGPKVLGAYRLQGLQLQEALREGDWLALTLRLPPSATRNALRTPSGGERGWVNTR